MKKYLLTEIPHNTLNAGYKAKNDIRTVLKNEGFCTVDISESFKFDKIPEYFKLIKNLISLERGAELIVQWPIYSFFNSKFMPLFLSVLEKKEFKIILVIHDLESVRFASDEKSVALEKKVLDLSQKIVVHNDSMKNFLCERFGIGAKKLVSLGIFDYLCDEVKRERNLSDGVCLAGNLDPNKSGYIYRLGSLETVTLNVYGGNFDEKSASKSINYKGSFQPHELPFNLEGGFGLVWDGNSEDTCEGITGQYLKINNPHKTSLYLASSLPVIIWKEAALAPFIEKNNLGFSVSSLAEIKAKLDAMTQEDYTNMLSNVKKIGAHLRRGSFIKSAVKKCEEELV